MSTKRHARAMSTEVIRSLGFVAVIVLSVIWVVNADPHRMGGSVEMYYTDASARGLQIVPASGGSVMTQPEMYPVQCLDNGYAILSWGSVPGAQFYWLRYNNSPLPCKPGWFSANPGECDFDWHTGNSDAIPIVYDHTYNWWIHAYDGTVSPATQVAFSCPSPVSEPPPTTDPAPVCIPSSHCGVSVLADCSEVGTYDQSLPGCSTPPSGCGPGTLNDQCTQQCAAGSPVSVTCAPEPPCSALGYVFTEQGNSCVFSRCADGWQQIGNSCVINQCPEGYIRNGNTCVAGCSAGYFYCGTGDNTGMLYQRSYTAAPACTPRDLVYAACDYGCNASRGACNPTPESGASISVRPSLVRQGATTQVSWQAASVVSCTIVGSNGDAWSCTGSACESGLQTSSSISAQTSFMLTCKISGSPNIVKDAVVNVLPTFIEQ